MDLNLGIVGNCQYSALVAATGDVAWLCWPRLDSSFVFGSLLDEARGGHFQIAPASGGTGVQSYVDNTNVLKTRFTDSQGVFEVIDFAPRFYQYGRFYKPKMLIRIVRPVSGTPVIRVRCEPVYDYGRISLHGQTRSNHLIYEGGSQPLRLLTNGSLYSVQEARPFALTETHYYILSWGLSIHQDVRELAENHCQRTVDYWQRWVKHCHVPRDYQQPVIRSALTLKLHQFEDTGAIIAATTTSIPEAAGTERTWDYRYCWLRDANFTLTALRRLGHFEELEGFVSYLRNLVEGSQGRLQPVYGISGERVLTERQIDTLAGYRGHKPVRVGNQAYEHLQHDIYGEMILAISPLFTDARFPLTDAQRPRGLLTALLRAIETYLEQPDASLWEFRGTTRIHTFTLLMHWAGAAQALRIAQDCKYADLAPLAETLVLRSARLISETCWNAELGAFVQAPGTQEMDAALLQIVNLGFLRRDDPRALSHVHRTSERLGISGSLLRRYRHADDFGQTNNAFTICSFWLAEALGRIGDRKAGRAVFETLQKGATPLGLFSEDLQPDSLEPWGNFPQAYSHVGQINAAFALSEPWD